jgi:hypothetical protein
MKKYAEYYFDSYVISKWNKIANNLKHAKNGEYPTGMVKLLHFFRETSTRTMLRRNPENMEQAINIINEMRNPEHYMFHTVDAVDILEINRMAAQTLMIIRNTI